MIVWAPHPFRKAGNATVGIFGFVFLVIYTALWFGMAVLILLVQGVVWSYEYMQRRRRLARPSRNVIDVVTPPHE